MEFEKQIKAEENGKVAKPRKEGELSDDELKNVSGGCGDPYTEIYCHKCGWTTKWNGYYPALRGTAKYRNMPVHVPTAVPNTFMPEPITDKFAL